MVRLVFFLFVLFFGVFLCVYFLRDGFHDDEKTKVFVGGRGMIIPNGYFYMLSPPKKEDVDSVYLWFLLPNMSPYNERYRQHFYSSGFDERVVTVLVSSGREWGRGLLGCRDSYDDYMKCQVGLDGLLLDIGVSGGARKDIEVIIGLVRDSLNKFIVY